MRIKIGTLVKINGGSLNLAIGYNKFGNSEEIRALKLTQTSLFVLTSQYAEILNLPMNVDDLNDYGAVFVDLSNYMIFDINLKPKNPADKYHEAKSNIDVRLDKLGEQLASLSEKINSIHNDKQDTDDCDDDDDDFDHGDYEEGWEE